MPHADFCCTVVAVGKKEAKQPMNDESKARPLFQAAYYRALRPDVAGSDEDLLRHYVTLGWKEGSFPHPLFDPRYVVWLAGSRWPADVEPFGYWQQGGWMVDVAPHPLFDLSRIRVAAPDGDPLAAYEAADISPHALFDRGYYLAQTLASPFRDPFTHYVLVGRGAGHAPHPFFDPAYYLAQRPDVAAAAMEPLTHYVQFGHKEGSNPHPLISTAHYRAQAGEVEPVTHYLSGGGRLSPHPLFDVDFFLKGTERTGRLPLMQYLDSATFQSTHPLFDVEFYRRGAGRFSEPPLLHYLTQPSPVSTHPLFDEAWYRVRAGVTGPALTHYLEKGAAMGLAPHPLFDSSTYFAPGGVPPLLHYVSEGERQGRRPNRLFSPPFYRATARVDAGAFVHYVKTGEADGRAASPEFRGRRYASRFLNGVVVGAMAHALQHPKSLQPTLDVGSVAIGTVGGRAGPKNVAASIVRFGVCDGEARRIQRAIHGNRAEVELDDVRALVAWAKTATGPVVLLSGAAIVEMADLSRLIVAAPCHPVILDRAGDVHSAGVILLDGLAWPRGAGRDPMEPALNFRHPRLTAGPVLALSSPTLLESLDPRLTVAEVFLTLSQKSTFLPTARAINLAATVGGPDQTAVPWGIPIEAPRPLTLFIESILPRLGFDAGSYYALQLMEMYRGFGYDVTLIPDAELEADEALVRVVADRGVRVLQAPFVPATADYISRTTDEFAVIVMARHTSGGRYFEDLRARWPTARLVFHPGDLHYLREQRAAILMGDPIAVEEAVRTREREMALIAGADVTVVVSSHEREVLVAAGLGEKVVQVDPEYSNRAPARYDAATRSGVAFIGGFGHAPNVDAVRYLCTEIWPIVSGSRPDIVLHVVGSAPPVEFEKFASSSVVIHGRVDDLDGLLDSLRLTVAPLRFGAGVKMKLITSLAAGVPSIVTPIAVEGTGLRTDGAGPSGVFVASDAASIAGAVLDLYGNFDKLNKMSEAGYKAVFKRFSSAAVRRHYRNSVGV